MKIDIKQLSNNAKMPTRGTAQSAGYDLYNPEGDCYIAPHDTVKIDIGLAIALPENTFGAIFARSGLSVKKSLRPANCCGIIDADYRGPIIVALHNDSDTMQTISAGERIAQLVVMPFIPVEFNIVDELDETERGEGRLGSTGKF